MYYTPEDAPMGYAMTQNNLGVAYRRLSGVKDKEENLRLAIAAYEEASEYYTPEDAPVDYAKLQSNIGWAYKDLDNIKDAKSYWKEAIRFFEKMDMQADADKVRGWLAGLGE